MALGQNIGELAVGGRADLLVLDGGDPFLATAQDSELLNRWIFACAANPIKDVMTGGSWVIRDGRHAKDEEIKADFTRVLKQLTR